MSSIHFVVPVAAELKTVQRQMKKAAKDPSEFVKMFTTSQDVIADVAEGRNDVWRIRVEGPQFRSSGTAALRPAATRGTDIEIQIEVRGKGWLSLASPIIALASGKIEGEATEALQKEFGARP
ncbi:MAG: hypothetical protein HKN03_08995 [Acidimicrobiales bacterium]|nr:hypothetical protein [Acidimicrobiales bacterium]